MSCLAEEKTSNLDELILATVEKDDPKTVKQLLTLIKDRHGISEEKTMKHVLSLQNQGKLTLRDNQSRSPTRGSSHFFARKAVWYWITIALTVASAASVFTIAEDAFPLVYVRYSLGSLLVIFLPGYSFAKALFPKRVPFETGSEELDFIERVALGIGMSLALVPITGLLLRYTPWGTETTLVTLSLLALTVAFSTVAIIREY